MPLTVREYRLNERIRVREVRVIDEDGAQKGVMPTEQARKLAEERSLDLVEVAPAAVPPVVRIMDYGKFKYEQAKKENESRKKQKNVVLREVTMKPKIGQHDIDFKTRTAIKLLAGGDKVKISVMFRGREITHPDIGRRLIERILAAIEEAGAPLLVEKPIGLEGRFMTTIIAEDRVRAAAIRRAAERTGKTAPDSDRADSSATAPVAAES